MSQRHSGRYFPPREKREPWLPAGVIAARIVPLDYWSEDQEQQLTQEERLRASAMGARRRKSFTAVRMCLKAMARTLEPELRLLPMHCLETLHGDRICPRLPMSSRKFCSASHGGKLVMALAADLPVGADVEPLSDKAARGASLFMSPRELRLAQKGDLPFAQAALRVWGLKEAGAKALGLGLPQAWQEIEAGSLQGSITLASFRGRRLAARHRILNEHLLTALVSPWTD